MSKAQSIPDTESASAKKFNAAWRQVINQQRKNDRLRDEVQAFAQEVRNQLENDEKFNMDITYRVCLHLLSFCDRKSMPHWQRITLIEWVDEFHGNIVNNPFGQHLDLISLRQSIQVSLAAAYPEQVFPSPFDLPEDGDARTQEEMFADLFDELVSTGTEEHSGAEDERIPEEAFYEEFYEQARRAEQQIEDDSQVIRQLMKASSVSKLFRKLAGILHPDKEQDETARIEKTAS